MDEQQLLRLKPELDLFLDRFAVLFGREENQAHARHFVPGLFHKGQRRNAENIAETAAGGVVRTLQAFIATAAWSDRAVLDELRGAVLEALGDPEATINVDETGFPKKGTESVGVKRQYSGTLGRTDNCQIGVFANYASVRGHTFIDRRLYLPREWAEDLPRRTKAKVPPGVTFRTKPELALEMVAAAVEAGVPFRWVGGDGVYGDNPTFVQGIRGLAKWYVLDVASDTQVWTTAPQVVPPDPGAPGTRGRKPTRPSVVGARERIDALVAGLPGSAWQRVVVGDGSQGPRVYDYAELPVWFCEHECPGPPERLLVRRSIGQDPELKYHRSNAPPEIGLEKLARVRGTRWTIEEDIKACKGECGLDEYETRGWIGWHHHTALAMLALVFLILQQRRLLGGTVPVASAPIPAPVAVAPVGPVGSDPTTGAPSHVHPGEPIRSTEAAPGGEKKSPRRMRPSPRPRPRRLSAHRNG